MSLARGTYSICSLVNGYKIGRSLIEPMTLLPKPVESFSPPNLREVHPWVLEESESGAFKIIAGGFATGVKDGLVFVFLTDDDKPSSWKIEPVPQMGENCFIIDNVDGTGAWTLLDTENEEQVAIRMIIAKPSDPPQYQPSQVFVVTSAPEK